jgi:multidrug efflux pump subunit AcrA (membrane-fusion protein)
VSTDSVSKQEADEKIASAASGDAQMQAARANVQRLRELSGFEKVVAPFDGVVTARNTDIGQLIAAARTPARRCSASLTCIACACM